MRLLVTGASGFVGQEFLKSCPKGWETICLGRADVPHCTQWIKCDLSNLNEINEASRSVQGNLDAIVHLAAYVPKVAEQDLLEESIKVNIVGTANLLQSFGKRCQKLVLGSTAEVYDQAGIHGRISESNNVGPLSYYAVTKLSSEFMATSYAKKNSIGITILRFSVMYGGNDLITRALPNFIRAAKHNATIHITNPKTLRDYIHLDDVVASIIAAVKEPECGIVNIGSGTGVSIGEASRAVIEATNSTSQVVIDSDSTGVDIVMDIAKAKDCLCFEPKVIFPHKLRDMTELYT